MMTTASITVGRYLATRLLQLNAPHVFGLPGDFNLTLLDEMTAEEGLLWVGSSNELNASYAADGYARVGRHVAALVTTFGVGELSALNGIAGSFAEDVPVLHIGGMPSRTAMAEGAPLHHTLLDGDFEHFVRMYREVTIAQEVLTAERAGAQIDRVLTEMLTASKPGYIGVPLDVASLLIPAAALATPLRSRRSDPGALQAFERALRTRFAEAGGITVLAGPRIHRAGLEAQVAGLAESSGVRIASQSGSKAILDEDHPASLGTYLGRTTKSEPARDAVDTAELLVMVGTVFSDFTTGFFTHRYDPSEAVELALDHARIGHAVYADVRLGDSLSVLCSAAADAHFDPAAALEIPAAPNRVTDPAAALDQAGLWAEIQRWLPTDTTVVAEAGTSFYGALDLVLPARSDLLGQPVWSSIGYTLPAAFGAALARRDRRPVLFIGDGSAQLTIQELGHLLRAPSAPIVFLLDNEGYTVERAIQSPEAVYQDIPRWDWQALPAALGAPAASVTTAATIGELRDVLAGLADGDRAHFVHLRLPRLDAPRLLRVLAEGIAAANTVV